jgi:DNA repair exonuclease SbcCD ATPase subunit
VFKKLEGKNFLSFGSEKATIVLQPGVNAIVGINLDKEDSRNGAGKSTVTELLHFALYGTTLREISKEFICNSFTNKRCEVSLELDIINNNAVDSYTIVRKLNPTKCVVYKNGKDVTLSTLAKTNNLIQQLIRTPSVVFQNSVIMSANNAVPFMALTKTDKRKFIESVLGLEVFTDMVLKVRDDYSIAKKDYEIAYTTLEQHQKELTFNQAQLNNYENLKQERISKLETKINSIQEDVLKLTNTINNDASTELEDIKQKIEKLESKKLDNKNQIDLINKAYSKVQAELNSEIKQLERMQTSGNECPTCLRKFSTKHTKHVAGLILEHQQAIQRLEQNSIKLTDSKTMFVNKHEKLDEQIKSLLKEKSFCDQKILDNQQIKNSLTFFATQRKELEHELEGVKKEHNNELKGKVSSLEEATKLLSDKVSFLNNELNILETVKFVISEEGIKSFIVKKILKVLNSRLAFYLKKLESNCLCQFNEFFEEEIIDEKSHPKSYFNFSGGERKRIDLSCLFAFADIRRLQGDVNFNTVFYDELLDSSLDDKGVQLVLRLLRERYQDINESCYIITHRGPEVTSKAEHTIKVTKKNGISQISS